MNPRNVLFLCFLILLAAAVTRCGRDDEAGMPRNGMPRNGMMDEMPMEGMPMGEMPMMQGDTPEWMMSRGDMPAMGDMAGMMEAMPVIHELLVNHDEIRREVEEIPGGVRTLTTSENPRITEAIRLHVAQMKERVENGRPIRMMDPLFREIFEHHEKIEMTIEEVPGGVRVTETSSDPQVVLLIRQHARRAVSEFVAQGMSRAMQPTPLPEGYRGED